LQGTGGRNQQIRPLDLGERQKGFSRKKWGPRAESKDSSPLTDHGEKGRRQKPGLKKTDGNSGQKGGEGATLGDLKATPGFIVEPVFTAASGRVAEVEGTPVPTHAPASKEKESRKNFKKETCRID